MASWSNWAGNVVAQPALVVAPATIVEMQSIVANAARRGQPIRVAGSGHSFAPLCQTDGVLIDLVNFAGIESVDAVSGDATIRAGTKLHAIGEPLFHVGRALANQGDIDRQALAGAVSTGTHGTGRRYGSFSNAVRAIEFLTSAGELVTIDETSQTGYLQAAALSLGMFGIVTRIRLATEPVYKLRERNRSFTFDACLEEFPLIESTHRNAEFWWIPPLDTCVIKSFNESDEEPFSQPEIEYPQGTLERYLKPDKVDWSYRVYPSTRSQQFVECEYTLPIANGPAAVRAIRAMMQAEHPEIRYVVEYRTMPGEPHLLSPTAGVDAVTISVHQQADLPWESFMQDCESIFRDNGGRPHWGKLHQLTRRDVDALYPGAAAFRQIRAEFDPEGLFLNDHLRPLFA